MTDTYRRTIVHNSLTPKWEMDTDPGDYPSNAGSCPRRPRPFVAEITGSLIVTCEPPDLDEDEWRFFMADIADDVCPSVKVMEWARFSDAIVSNRQTCVWVPMEWEDVD